jgi:hypothetical protein
MAEDFLTTVARWIAGTLYFSVRMQAAREMYGKSYFALGVVEQASLDQLVFVQVSAPNYEAMTPENLAKKQAPQSTGFQPQTPKTS